MNIERRNFLRGAAAAIGGTAAGVLAEGSVRADAAPAPVQPTRFFGPHQAGIVTPKPANAIFAAFDLTVSTPAALRDLLRTITARARFLTSGGMPPNLGMLGPSPDSGLLGPEVIPGGLTVTLAFGSSMFDSRFGLSAKKPLRLRPMDTFPNDNLDPARCHGDLLLQLCGDADDVVIHALRDIARNTQGMMTPRWRVNGFASPSRPDGAPRNLMGFHDGTANPVQSEFDQLVWTNGGGEPAWTTGGTYFVMRRIRMLVEFWDRVSIAEQEGIIGRRRDSGAPMTGKVETDIPDYTNDPFGDTTPLTAHIRMSNPRTRDTDDTRILRRGYNFDDGIDSNGNLDMGLAFVSFQQDLDRQFVATQNRLIDEPLADYISPVGGGYFFAPPGVANGSDYLGRGLFS